MGRAKNERVRRDGLSDAAASYLVHVGTLSECESHGYLEDGDGDLDRLWPTALNDYEMNDDGPVPWAADLELWEFRELLKETYEGNCGNCSVCEDEKSE
jgi:hypothetical protein